MKLTLAECKKIMSKDGSLYLNGCESLTGLPEGLSVGGSLYLNGCESLTGLPEGLSVGGNLDLRGCTSLTGLPEGLSVGAWLDLSGCESLTSLPEGLSVGDSLYLNGCTSLTSLPEGLTVGCGLDLRRCTKIKEMPESAIVQGEIFSEVKLTAKRLREGEYIEGRCILADGILTAVTRKREMMGYVWYAGKNRTKNVISDGEYYAHCRTFSEGVRDIKFKKCRERGAEQYAGLSVDSVVSTDDAVVMYRVITGACEQGTRSFLNEIGELKDAYTIREIIEITRGRYGAETFKGFFEKNEE